MKNNKQDTSNSNTPNSGGMTAKAQQRSLQIKMPRNRVYTATVIVLLVFIALGMFWLAYTQERIYKIQNETHIESLYSTYRSNMESCKEQAKEANMDEEFIQENCIDEINNSIIGDWLSERRPDLIITE